MAMLDKYENKIKMSTNKKGIDIINKTYEIILWLLSAH